jgi:aspartate/methionine/tyrosine aminotransferase
MQTKQLAPPKRESRLSEIVQAEMDQSEKQSLGPGVWKTGSPYAMFVILESANELAAKGKDVIFCAESIMSTRPPDFTIKTTSENLAEAASHEVPPMNGLPELRKEIASRFTRVYGQKVDWMEQVVVTSGSFEAEFHAIRAVLNPGDEVVMATPSFRFDRAVRLAGGKPVFYKLDPSKKYYHFKDQIEKQITQKTRMIILCNPDNPTGRVLTKEELSGVAELAIKHDLFILHDQVYERLVYDNRPYLPMAGIKEVHDRLITATSFSKLFNMINYRLGYSIAPPDVTRGISILHGSSSGGVSVILQRGAMGILTKEFEENYVTNTVRILQKGRDYAMQKLSSLKGVSIVEPEGTNLLFPNISSFGMTSMEFCQYLLREALVACDPGISDKADDHIRISLKTERNEEAIDRIAKAISKLSPRTA